MIYSWITLPVYGLSHLPGERGERIDMIGANGKRVLFDEVKPVAAPCHVANNGWPSSIWITTEAASRYDSIFSIETARLGATRR